MSEKTQAFTKPESAGNGESALTLEILEERVFELLRGGHGPLTATELTTAINGNGCSGQVEERHVRLALEELHRAGRVTYLNREDLEHQLPLTERAKNLLETTQMPMDVSQVYDQLSQAGCKIGSRRYLREMLAMMHRQGRVKRLEEGVYTHASFDRRSYKRRSFEDSKGLVLEILTEEPEKDFSLEDIASAMTARTGIPTDSRFALVQVGRLCRQGSVVRVGHNKYAAAEIAGGSYESPPPVDELLIDTLTQAGGPLTRKQLLTAVKSGAGQYPPTSHTVDRHLKRLTRDGQISYVQQGVYAPAGFDRQQYERPRTARERIVEILSQSPEPLHVDEITERIGELSGQPLSRKTIHSTLHILKNAGQITSPNIGFFAERHPDDRRPAVKHTLPEATLLSVISEAGTGATLEDITAAVRAMNIMTLPRTIRKRLTDLEQRQLVEQTDSGWRRLEDSAEIEPEPELEPETGNEQPAFSIYKRIRQLLADISDWESAEDLLGYLAEEGYAITPKMKTFVANRLTGRRR